jgi:diacylglycerol kinase (ATP)
MNTFLFINPASGRFASRRVSSVINLLQAAGLPPTVYSVRTPAEALPCCRIINETSEKPLVIVAAGDGTVNAVVNGLTPGSATLAVLPLGTSNVLAAEIGIRSVEDGIKRIVAGKTKPLSIGVLKMEHECFRFVLMAGVGLDGSVVRDVWPPAKRLLRQGAYAISALLSALTWDKSLIEVITAERTVKCHSVIICSASRYGGNFILSPDSNLFSPELTAVCIRKNGIRTYLRLAFELLTSSADTSREMIRIPSDGIEIRGTKPIQVDGDFVGYSPAKLHTIAEFAQIIV